MSDSESSHNTKLTFVCFSFFFSSPLTEPIPAWLREEEPSNTVNEAEAVEAETDSVTSSSYIPSDRYRNHGASSSYSPHNNRNHNSDFSSTPNEVEVDEAELDNASSSSYGRSGGRGHRNFASSSPSSSIYPRHHNTFTSSSRNEGEVDEAELDFASSSRGSSSYGPPRRGHRNSYPSSSPSSSYHRY